MRENGQTIKRMDTEFRRIKMVRPTRGIGRMIYTRVMVNSQYKMAPYTRAISKMELKVERVKSSTSTVLYTMAFLRTTS